MRYISPIFCSPRMSAPRPELPSIYISSLGARRIPPSVTLPSISALIPSALRAPSRGPCNRAYGAPASPAWDLVLARSCARSHSCSNREDDDGSATRAHSERSSARGMNMADPVRSEKMAFGRARVGGRRARF